jgi:hypothetical protein
VLRRHYGLKGRVPSKGKHLDLHEVMTAKAGFRVSLDAAAMLNLGERKHTDGRDMAALNLDALKVACRSDVCQTYRLFKRHTSATLRIPARAWTNWSADSEKSHSDAPRECPCCHALDCLNEVEWDMGEMTDGQFADYLAGMHGSAECANCGEVIDWGL